MPGTLFVTRDTHPDKMGAFPPAVPSPAVDKTAVVSSRGELGEGLGRGIGAEKKLVIVTGSCMLFPWLNRMI